jgi:hypothetical protein
MRATSIAVLCCAAVLAGAAANQTTQTVSLQITNDNPGDVRVFLAQEGNISRRLLTRVTGRRDTVRLPTRLKDRHLQVEITGEHKGWIWESEDLFYVQPGDCLHLRVGTRTEFTAVTPCARPRK